MTTSDEADFLHSLPIALALEQRYVLEALSHGIDSLLLSYLRLKAHANTHASVTECSRHCQPTWFIDAWAMVDAAYAVRTSLTCKQLSFLQVDLTGFAERLEEASYLRNKRDHFPTNIRNLAAKKRTAVPAFGSVSYFKTKNIYTLEGEFNHVQSGFIPSDGDVTLPKPVDSSIEVPVGFFHLHAFERTLSLSDLSDTAQQIAKYFNGPFAQLAYQQISAGALAQGLALEDALKPSCSGLTVVLAMSGFAAKAHNAPE